MPQTKDHLSELLYFGDVCAGPGGFSEYILWKRRWHAKGFGMTLKGPCDFKLEDFFAAPSELFEPYYGRNDIGLDPGVDGVPDTDGSFHRRVDLCGFAGEGGVDGDGDITRPENMTAFRNFVMESTEKRGLHFLMADGVRAPSCVIPRISPAPNRLQSCTQHEVTWRNFFAILSDESGPS